MHTHTIGAGGSQHEPDIAPSVLSTVTMDTVILFWCERGINGQQETFCGGGTSLTNNDEPRCSQRGYGGGERKTAITLKS